MKVIILKKKRLSNLTFKMCGQQPVELLNQGAIVNKSLNIAHTLRARDYKGLDNYGSNGVLEWQKK